MPDCHDNFRHRRRKFLIRIEILAAASGLGCAVSVLTSLWEHLVIDILIAEEVKLVKAHA
jgi:hypothetical protein